jgi:cyclohexadienyl dehydratase
MVMRLGLCARRVVSAVANGAVSALVFAGCGSMLRPANHAAAGQTSAPPAVLKICTTGDYKPLTYYDPVAQQYSGIDIDMAKDFAAHLRRTPVFVLTRWALLTNDLVTLGKCDIAMGGISDTQAREQIADFTKPYLTNGKTPLTTIPRANEVQSIDQINQRGVRVIENAGGTNEQFARQHFPNATVIVWPDNTTIFDQLVSGRADVMITDAVEAIYQAKQHPELTAVHPDKPFTFDQKAYMLPKGSALLGEANEWLTHALSDGTFSRFYNAWMR